MSSQSGSEINNNRTRTNRSKKTKAEPVAEKRSRRSARKNAQFDDSENALPENIPITDSDELIMYHSYELEVTKGIIQIPASLFKTNKLRKQTWTRVGEIIIELVIANNQLGELSVLAKLKIEQSQNSISQQKNDQQNKDNKKKDKGSNGKISQQESEEESFGQQAIFLVWGKVCWIGAHQISNKTVKQSPKTINTEQFSEIVKVKTKDVNSDIFVVLNMKKKLDCVTDYNGLINQGNTCYMNSYLQMLSHISEFKNLVFEANIVDENKFPATLQLLFHKLDNEQKPVSAQQLVKSFGWSKKQANIQQDAQQFSCLFYDVLERKLQEACPDPKHMSMSEMFEGKLRNLIECLHVGNVLIYADFSSENIEPFFNLPLSLSKNLSQSLDDYVAEQILNEDNLYQTELYGPQIAKKSVRFLSLPPILMVQLKRFEFNYTTGRNEKIMQRFEYPNQIDFSKWQVMTEEQNQYELYAVLVHEGIKAESGHYYAFVKIKDEWYRFNDQEVSSATNVQVFDYNFGGQIDAVEFDVREFKVFNRKSVSSSTAYMLVYVKKQLKEKLLDNVPIYPEWLKTHEINKQEEREQIRIRKNFYHDIQVLEWEENFKDCIADYIGIIPKDTEDLGGRMIDKLVKSDKVEEWVKPYNQEGKGAYVYLTYPDKIQYEALINCQHRKNTFQQLIRDPSLPVFILFLPIIAKLQNLLYVIKLVSTEIKLSEQGEPEQSIKIRFHGLLQINRNSKNSQLLANMKQIYEEPGYVNRYFYEQKKQLVEIKQQNCLIKGPLIQRNILGIIIVEKIQVERVMNFKNCTVKWYNDLKNFVQIYFKSEDGNYEFRAQMDQNRSVQSLREYIFEKLKQDEACSSSDNIVLKAKPKKTAKNYLEVTGAKTIRDLLKNCDKEYIIIFGFSNLKADERINQIEVKFMYRFSDFSYSEAYHVVLDRKSQNQSFNIYQKISEHEEVQKFKKAEHVEGIRIFLFSKDKNVINDIITEGGYVPNKGEIAQVLQKERTSHLVVEGFKSVKIEQKMCPILLHHRSQNDDKVGIPRYLEFDRSTKLTEIYEQILELIKDEVYEWQDKKVKINPMKVTVYAYSKDYNKGIYLADQQTLRQFQIEQEQRNNEKSSKNAKQKQKDQLNEENQLELIREMVIDEQQNEDGKKVIVIDSMESEKVPVNSQAVSEGANKNNGEDLIGGQSSSDNQKQNQQKRKNSKCANKIKPWDKTIEIAFPKVKSIKIVVHHLYMTKAQTAMKINVE